MILIVSYLHVLIFYQFSLEYFYAPIFEKVGNILNSACVSVHMSMGPFVRDIVSKFRVWISHGKIADAFLELSPLVK